MSRPNADSPALPPPPPMPRELRLERAQRFGLPFVFLLPALALSGLIGPRTEVVHAAGPGLSLEVEYPDRAHARDDGTLVVRVRNDRAEPLENVRISIDGSWLSTFLDAVPMVDLDRGLELDAARLEPGASRSWELSLTPKGWGRHAGAVAARARGVPEVAVRLETVVFP